MLIEMKHEAMAAELNHRLVLTLYNTCGCNPFTGYGRVELGLAKGLQGRGVRLRLWPEAGGIVLVSGYATWLDAPHIADSRRWMMTMSETTLVSQKWVDVINKKAERVLVPCPGLVDVYQQSGVTVPVHYVPLGVDLFTPPTPPLPIPPHPYPSPQVEREKGEGGEQDTGNWKNGRFVFLTYSLGDLRKGAELVIATFLRAFGGDDNYRLKIKARDGYNTWIAGLEHPQITVVTGVQLSWDELLARADCFVFPSRGEGFGLPPREATLAGVPTIATRWLGMWDVDQWGYPLGYTRMRLAEFDQYEANAEGAEYVEPDAVQLQSLMEQVAADPASARMFAIRGREYLLANFTWDQTAQRIIALAEEYA